MPLNRNSVINQIADDWLLVFPDTYKASLVSALSTFDQRSLDEIYAFHDRIKEFPADKKREVLADLPKSFKGVIEEMLAAYVSELEKANNAYYNADSPRMEDRDKDVLAKLLRINTQSKIKYGLATLKRN